MYDDTQTGGVEVKKINWKILNLAFWVEVVLSYVLPFKVIDNQYRVGFPIPFITVHDSAIGVNPLMSMYLNPIGLLSNGIIIYIIILSAVRMHHTIKSNYTK